MRDPQRGIAAWPIERPRQLPDLAREEARARSRRERLSSCTRRCRVRRNRRNRVSPLRDDSMSAAPAEAGPAPLSPAPANSFQALATTGPRPPRHPRRVGPNHLMTVLNTQILIQDKTGTVLSPAVSMDSFWASLGNRAHLTPRSSTTLRRPMDLRCGANGSSTTSAVLIGVSRTNDRRACGISSVSMRMQAMRRGRLHERGFHKD